MHAPAWTPMFLDLNVCFYQRHHLRLTKGFFPKGLVSFYNRTMSTFSPKKTLNIIHFVVLTFRLPKVQWIELRGPVSPFLQIYVWRYFCYFLIRVIDSFHWFIMEKPWHNLCCILNARMSTKQSARAKLSCTYHARLYLFFYLDSCLLCDFCSSYISCLILDTVWFNSPWEYLKFSAAQLTGLLSLKLKNLLCIWFRVTEQERIPRILSWAKKSKQSDL